MKLPLPCQSPTNEGTLCTGPHAGTTWKLDLISVGILALYKDVHGCRGAQKDEKGTFVSSICVSASMRTYTQHELADQSGYFINTWLQMYRLYEFAFRTAHA